nr:hypothetical protein [Tanacetum cinerariifolium]
MQTNQFAEAVSSILRIVDRYIDHRMNEAINVTVQLQSDRLRDEVQAKNEDFINKLDENIQKIIKEHVKVHVSKILPKIKKTVNKQPKAEVLTRSSNSSKTSYAVAADLSELELKKILIEKMESNKINKEISTKLWLMLMNGSKRKREGKEPESTSAPKEKASKTTGVEIYQKKLNLTKPDSYRTDLKRKEAYTAYSNPRGFIYQNKDKQKRLTRIDELHKFSNGTLNDVRTTLDYHLKGIRMKYLPQTIWRRSDKERAAAMIQVIDKQLKTRRIM